MKDRLRSGERYGNGGTIKRHLREQGKQLREQERQQREQERQIGEPLRDRLRSSEI